MRHVAELAAVGAVFGLLIALLASAAHHEQPCRSAGQHASNACSAAPPGRTGLLIGLGLTGAGIGAVCGAAWEAERRKR